MNKITKKKSNFYGFHHANGYGRKSDKTECYHRRHRKQYKQYCIVSNRHSKKVKFFRVKLREFYDESVMEFLDDMFKQMECFEVR